MQNELFAIACLILLLCFFIACDIQQCDTRQGDCSLEQDVCEYLDLARFDYTVSTHIVIDNITCIVSAQYKAGTLHTANLESAL